MPQIHIILSILQMRKRSSGCSYHGQSHTASERLRLNPGLSDIKVLFSLHMVNGTSSVFNQHFNVTSEKYENGKERILHFLAEINAQQNVSFPHALVTRILLERVTTTTLHQGVETAIVGSCQGPLTCQVAHLTPLAVIWPSLGKSQRRYRYILHKLTWRF